MVTCSPSGRTTDRTVAGEGVAGCAGAPDSTCKQCYVDCAPQILACSTRSLRVIARGMTAPLPRRIAPSAPCRRSRPAAAPPPPRARAPAGLADPLRARSSLVWGFSFLLIKVGNEGFAPFQVTLGRLVFGTAVLAAAMAVDGSGCRAERGPGCI